MESGASGKSGQRVVQLVGLEPKLEHVSATVPHLSMAECVLVTDRKQCLVRSEPVLQVSKVNIVTVDCRVSVVHVRQMYALMAPILRRTRKLQLDDDEFLSFMEKHFSCRGYSVY